MITILAVDDNVDDLALLQRALVHSELPWRLFSAADGEEAEDYLRGVTEREYDASCPLPDVICLDLHMPRKGGLETLEWLKGQPKLKDIPVVIVSASDDPAEVKRAYELGAVAYLSKPARYEALDDLLGRLED